MLITYTFVVLANETVTDTTVRVHQDNEKHPNSLIFIYDVLNYPMMINQVVIL